MDLYIGGFAQGKRRYVLNRLGLTEQEAADGAALADSHVPAIQPEQEEIQLLPAGTKVLDHFHEWFRSRLAAGGNPEEEAALLLERLPRLIVISDEVGNGIVPLKAEEREYRERLGRCLCVLAERAEHVERIICGIGQQIK